MRANAEGKEEGKLCLKYRKEGKQVDAGISGQMGVTEQELTPGKWDAVTISKNKGGRAEGHENLRTVKEVWKSHCREQTGNQRERNNSFVRNL